MRWPFYGPSDVNVTISLATTAGFPALCTAAISWIFKTGYELKA